MVRILIQMPREVLSGLKEMRSAKGLEFYPEYGKHLINISYCYYGESGIDSIKSQTQCLPANLLSLHLTRTGIAKSSK